MLKVGLTGNIASGKSSVARVWQRLGATIIDADVLARRAVAPGSVALARIVEQWGEGVLDASGELDRAAMRDIVFRDPAARERLEAIIHPAVYQQRDREMVRAANAGAHLVVADIPLLFEVGLEDDFDVVVLVDAPEEVRFQRLVRDRGLEAAEARRMIAAQMPSERKRERAGIVIENSGSVEELERRAAAVWSELEDRAGVDRSRDA